MTTVNIKLTAMKQKEQSCSFTLLELYDEEVKRLEKRIGKDRSVRTLSTLKQGRRHLAAYLADQLKCKDVPANELSPQLIEDYSVYLSAERGLMGGTVWLACQHLKGVVTRSYQRGIISKNPFCGFHIRKNIRPREFLTEEELAQLMTHSFSKENLSRARDIFLFSALTGLSFIDICELRPENIVNIGGAAWILSRRHKTNIPYQVKLLKVPLRIISRYQREENEKVFGRLEYRAVARHIQQVMKEMGFNKHVTMHCARHSFAVLAISKGMPIESISRILGHTNITTTQIYAKITMQKLQEDMAAFEKSLSGMNKYDPERDE